MPVGCLRVPRKRVPCRVCGGLLEPSATSAAAPAHRKCQVSEREHGTVVMYEKGKCRCAGCRAAKAADQKRWYHAYQERMGAPYQYNKKRNPDEGKVRRVCDWCGEQYFGWGEKFCSRECLMRAGRGTRCTDLVHVPRARPEWTGSDLSRGWTFFSGACSWCGGPFVMPHQAALFCSTRCSRYSAKSLVRKARGEFSITDAERLALYERDGWVCQLCFQPVNRERHYLAPDAPTLDHIECQSWVLIPDHSPSNLRLAHRACNSLRGNREWPADVSA